MENREDIEAWADELLDRHRTPDVAPSYEERRRRRIQSYRRLEGAEAIVTIAGVVLLGWFLVTFYSGF